jgi:hypothetical protein
VKVKNKIFQFVWYIIIRQFYSEGEKLTLEDRADRMIAQAKWARKFGAIHTVLIGDSNSEIFRQRKDMSRFPKLAVSLGCAGFRADQWMEFLINTEKGRELYELIKDIPAIIWNIGGNNILHDLMDKLEPAIAGLKIKFPMAWFCLIPPVHIEVKLPEIKKANTIIKRIAKPLIIDLYTPFVMENGKPIPGTHSDFIHFSEISQDLILKVITRL